MARPRVIVADDHTLLAEAFATLLAAEYDVIAQVGDGRALRAASCLREQGHWLLPDMPFPVARA